MSILSSSMLFNYNKKNFVYSLVLWGNHFLQEFVVYTNCCILKESFKWITGHQVELSCKMLYGLENVVNRGKVQVSMIGKPYILPLFSTSDPDNELNPIKMQ